MQVQWTAIAAKIGTTAARRKVAAVVEVMAYGPSRRRQFSYAAARSAGACRRSRFTMRGSPSMTSKRQPEG